MEATQNLSDACIIGKGGHGTVYKATLPSTGAAIVVKKIDVEVHKSFLTEIETIGNAKHRNLVKLLGFCKWGEVGLLMYDYIPNGDLHEALHNKEKAKGKGKGEVVLDWAARVRIAEGVAHGLAYLHHDYIPSIIHRDIKASNVLLDEDLEPHISDFGVAKVMALQPFPVEKQVTSTAVISGTYGYLAPGEHHLFKGGGSNGEGVIVMHAFVTRFPFSNPINIKLSFTTVFNYCYSSCMLLVLLIIVESSIHSRIIRGDFETVLKGDVGCLGIQSRGCCRSLCLH